MHVIYLDVQKNHYPDGIKEKSNYGFLPLHYACDGKSSLEVVKLLIMITLQVQI
jgi:hypothetical protein